MMRPLQKVHQHLEGPKTLGGFFQWLSMEAPKKVHPQSLPCFTYLRFSRCRFSNVKLLLNLRVLNIILKHPGMNLLRILGVCWIFNGYIFWGGVQSYIPYQQVFVWDGNRAISAIGSHHRARRCIASCVFSRSGGWFQPV